MIVQRVQCRTQNWPKLSFTNYLYKLVLKHGQNLPLFVYFLSFHLTNIAQILKMIKSVDGVLGTRTRDGKKVGADESTELWRHPL